MAALSAAVDTECSRRSFDTPLMDRESKGLLHRISKEGGYAFVGLVNRASDGSGDLRAAEAAREMAWEQLHSGPWHSVLPIWRDAYSMSCLLVARFHFAAGECGEALRALDMGLIMGGVLLREDLEAAVAELREFKNGSAVRPTDCRLDSLEFNEEEARKLLPLKSLSSKSVVNQSALSLEGFVRDYFLPGAPVIIRDGMGHWPASSKWNDVNYLRFVAGDRTVPVELNMCFRLGKTTYALNGNKSSSRFRTSLKEFKQLTALPHPHILHNIPCLIR